MNVLRLLLIFNLLPLAVLHSQPVFDECSSPIEINLPLGNWCSDEGQFSNAGTTLSTNVVNPACWPDEDNRSDMWFTFNAAGTDMSILVNGTGAGGGSLELPQYALFRGDCNGTLTLVDCFSDAFGDGVIEAFVNDLTIGERYYLMVSARNGREGSYQLCINSFNAVPDPKSDCRDGVLLCDKSTFNVQNLQGAGLVRGELNGTCLDVDPNNDEEFASSWYKWVCDEPGTLTFTLTPNLATDDLDFVVYELPGGIDDCDNKVTIRCMASGENVDGPPAEWEPCTGPTGLALDDPDIAEQAGCQPGDNNFVRHIDMEAGKAYALVVNNFSNTGNGFTIDWGGTGTFVGPTAELVVLDSQTVECDKEFTIDANVNFPTGNIETFIWNFGVDAEPQRVNGPGPHQVTYHSIGEKSIILTIESDRGCLVNEVIEIFVEPCCEDLPDIDVQVDSLQDLICHGIPSGYLEVEGTGGSPMYNYSLNGANFQVSPIFQELDEGSYTVFIQDEKGCTDSVTAYIGESPPLQVDAGPDQEVDLGFGTDLLATPSTVQVRFRWEPAEAADPPDQPETFVIPPGTTTFTVTVTDSAGCTASDEVTVFVLDKRPVYIPDAISPNGDGVNDRLGVFSNPAADEVLLMQIFSRWGNKVFEERNIPLNDTRYGWDGSFNGEPMDPGVFVYKIIVGFIDGREVVYSGEMHLLR